MNRPTAFAGSDGMEAAEVTANHVNQDRRALCSIDLHDESILAIL